MVPLRLAVVVALLVGSSIAPFASGHGRHTEGELLACNDAADTGIYALIESVAPGTVPNGVCHYYIPDAQMEFVLTSVDPQHAFVVGLADECPGPTWAAPLRQALLAGDVQGALGHARNAWLLCDYLPDFDVKFTGGDYGNGPGDEAGIVPCGPCGVVIVLFMGDETSPLGPEGFVFHDGL